MSAGWAVPLWFVGAAQAQWQAETGRGREPAFAERERLMQPVSWDRALWVGKDVSVDLWARRGTIWAERTPPKVVPHRSNSGRGGAQNQETHFAAGQRRLLTGLCFFDRSAPDRNTVATG